MKVIYSCTVTDDVINKARYDAFFYKKENTLKYAKRNQFNTDKIVDDMILGLSFELGVVYPYLCEKFGENHVAIPYVYDGDNERKINFKHDPDITVNNELHFHCKCIEKKIANTFGYGWMFQKKYLENNKKKLLNSDKDFIVFGTIDMESKNASIMVIQKFNVLFRHEMFEQPMKRVLREGKRVVKYSKFLEKDIEINTSNDIII
jgi:hypothetical protein